MPRTPHYAPRPMEFDPREERLPAWAQATINGLRARVIRAEVSAAEARLSGGPEDTDTLLDPYDETPIRLPKGARVRFLLGPEVAGRYSRAYVDASVHASYSGGPLYVEVMTGGTLAVEPQSSNVLRLTVPRD